MMQQDISGYSTCMSPPVPSVASPTPEGLVLDSHKLAWHGERVEAWLRGERIAPVTIDLALTRRCSYRCVYCYGKLQANDELRITRDVIYRFLGDAAEIGVKAVSFVSDGESTCSPHLEAAVLRAKEVGLDVALGTNGFLLADDRLEVLLPVLTYLRFNISAAEGARYAAIHGCKEACYSKVRGTIRRAVEVKRAAGLGVTIGLQMVLLPELSDQVIPLARLGSELGVDYLVIKHCSDDEQGTLGVDYDRYHGLVGLLQRAEALSRPGYSVRAKWSKILCGQNRSYSRCYGPPFQLQISGSGLVAPCGMLFNRRFRDFHIGNIAQTSFKELWQGDRYWQVLGRLASSEFDARTQCGTLCLQHKVNEALWALKEQGGCLPQPQGNPPMHVNFV